MYYWAQLFKATTWEEIGMLAEKSESISESIVTLKQLTEDEKIRMQCEAWEDHQRNMISIEKAGIQKGIEMSKKHIVENMIKSGMPDKEICLLAECETSMVDKVRAELEKEKTE